MFIYPGNEAENKGNAEENSADTIGGGRVIPPLKVATSSEKPFLAQRQSPNAPENSVRIFLGPLISPDALKYQTNPRERREKRIPSLSLLFCCHVRQKRISFRGETFQAIKDRGTRRRES